MREFQDIKIIGISDSESYRPDPDYALFNIVLLLSDFAPHDWTEYFHSAWIQHMYMSKKDVYVSGNRLTISCAPEDFEKKHLPEINKIINDTNREYRRLFEEELYQSYLKKKAKYTDREKIKDLKSNINFD